MRFRITSKGIGSSSEVETSLKISPADGGARVHWSADVKNLGGLLKAIPSGLIRGAAQKTIEGIWQGVTAKLAEG